MTENNNTQEESKNLNINPKRSPFTKLDNKRQNLHSLDVDRDEITEGDPSMDHKQEKNLQQEPWKKTKQ